jgi:chromosome segregation ATPase
MARIKRGSKALEQAEKRSAGLKAIDPKLDLGPGLKVEDFDAEISELHEKLNDYNETLALLDDKLNVLETLEKAVTDKSGRLLAGVGARYGKDSPQYELAGGIRTSERKKPAPRASKKKPPTS